MGLPFTLNPPGHALRLFIACVWDFHESKKEEIALTCCHDKQGYPSRHEYDLLCLQAMNYAFHMILHFISGQWNAQWYANVHDFLLNFEVINNSSCVGLIPHGMPFSCLLVKLLLLVFSYGLYQNKQVITTRIISLFLLFKMCKQSSSIFMSLK